MSNHRRQHKRHGKQPQMAVSINGDVLGHIDRIERCEESEQALMLDENIHGMIAGCSDVRFEWAVDGSRVNIVAKEHAA